jgi:hypothetical protein
MYKKYTIPKIEEINPLGNGNNACVKGNGSGNICSTGGR